MNSNSYSNILNNKHAWQTWHGSRAWQACLMESDGVRATSNTQPGDKPCLWSCMTVCSRHYLPHYLHHHSHILNEPFSKYIGRMQRFKYWHNRIQEKVNKHIGMDLQNNQICKCNALWQKDLVIFVLLKTHIGLNFHDYLVSAPVSYVLGVLMGYPIKIHMYNW